ncbi:hypothetical protein [Trinickia acidisoli]|uniref:hypothetical protein n=1 Tax=Trinickia acidisoli TaxID=2767482 RepID=UPI001A8C5FD7|nr:hypothetical protein [Trinickia acidisoli]
MNSIAAQLSVARAIRVPRKKQEQTANRDSLQTAHADLCVMEWLQPTAYLRLPDARNKQYGQRLPAVLHGHPRHLTGWLRFSYRKERHANLTLHRPSLNPPITLRTDHLQIRAFLSSAIRCNYNVIYILRDSRNNPALQTTKISQFNQDRHFDTDEMATYHPVHVLSRLDPVGLMRQLSASCRQA